MELAGAALLKRMPSLSLGQERISGIWQGFMLFISNCNPSGPGLSASPLPDIWQNQHPSPDRLALLKAPWKHGEWCLLAVEMRLAWLSLDLLFLSPINGALAREALLIAKLWNLPL